MAEQLTFNQRVLGSSPSAPITIKDLDVWIKRAMAICSEFVALPTRGPGSAANPLPIPRRQAQGRPPAAEPRPPDLPRSAIATPGKGPTDGGSAKGPHCSRWRARCVGYERNCSRHTLCMPAKYTTRRRRNMSKGGLCGAVRCSDWVGAANFGYRCGAPRIGIRSRGDGCRERGARRTMPLLWRAALLGDLERLGVANALNRSAIGCRGSGRAERDRRR